MQMANSEGARIVRQTDHITNQSVEATRRIKELANDTKIKGVETAVMLNRQGEQLITIERRTEEIEVDITHAEYQVSKLETCGCLSRCCKPRYTRRTNRNPHRNEEKPITSQPTAQRVPDGPFITRVLNDDREDEMENNLRETAKAVDTIKEIATDIGNEIDEQNETIKRLEDKVEDETEHIKHVTKRVKQQS